MMTTLTRQEIRRKLEQLEHGDPNYISHCAETYYQCNNREIQEDMIRRVASHCDLIAQHQDPLDSVTKVTVAHFLQSEAQRV